MAITNKLQAPAVFSAKLAVKKALEMKSFYEEKMAGAQLQGQKNDMLRQQRLEEDKQSKADKISREEKVATKVAKDNKDKATSGLAGLLGKSI